MIVPFTYYLHRERIEFNLTVFRKLFIYRATNGWVAFLAGSQLKVRETANKNHNWFSKFVFIKGISATSPSRLSNAARRFIGRPP
ncbi:hypothetical protein KSP40_PGU015496 [Platanthera guangdongensis]|uniref:Uncharacterized protein n=1 Tax=Platanthera guangdongensis TaxID=2320717 RepID=A0ABR2MNH9_9ASPA